MGWEMVRNSENKSRRNLFVVITIVLVLFLLIFLTELTLRIVWSGKEKAPVHESRNPFQPVSNKIISYTLKPNYRYKLLKYSTNNDGFRINKSITREKPANEYRVAMIGDSIVYGYNTRTFDTIGHFLEGNLNIHKYNSDIQFRVLNFGIPGYCMPQYLEVMKEYAFGYNPDLIVICTTVYNDYDGYRLNYLDKGYLSAEPVHSVHGYNYRLKVPPSFIRNFYLYRFIRLRTGNSWIENRKGIERMPDEKPLIRKRLPASCDSDDSVWDETADVLDEIVKLSKEKGCDLLFLIYPSREQIVYPDIPRAPQTILSAMLLERGLKYIDLISPFEKLYRSSTYIPFRDMDSHPDNMMNARAALEIKNAFFDKFREDITDWNDFSGEINLTAKGINNHISFGWGDKDKLDYQKLRWVYGAESEIIFPGFKDKANEISFEAVKYPECKYQQVRVSLNNKMLGTYDMSSSDKLRVYKVVPQKQITLQPVNHLLFRFSCSAREPGAKSTKKRTPVLRSAGFSYIKID